MGEASNQKDDESPSRKKAYLAIKAAKKPEPELRLPGITPESLIGLSAEEVLAKFALNPGIEEWTTNITNNELSSSVVQQLIQQSINTSNQYLVKGVIFSLKSLRELLLDNIRMHHANYFAARGEWDSFFLAPFFLKMALRIFARKDRGIPIFQDARYQKAMAKMYERLLKPVTEKNPEIKNPAAMFYDLLKTFGRSETTRREGNLTVNLLGSVDPEENRGDDIEIEHDAADGADERADSPQEDRLRAMTLNRSYLHAFESLPPKQQEVMLAYITGDDAKSIANRHDIAVNTVYSTVNAAKRNMVRSLVEQHGLESVFELLPESMKTIPIMRCLINCGVRNDR